MKCPYCNEEMEDGVIQSSHAITWHYKKRFIGYAEFHKGSDNLSDYSFFKGSAVKACCCKKCKKIIIGFNGEDVTD